MIKLRNSNGPGSGPAESPKQKLDSGKARVIPIVCLRDDVRMER